MKTPLEQELQKELREKGILQKDEVVFKEGDLLVAENVISGQKRILSSSILTENSKKQILFG